jgi:colicin import membrane protein
MKHLVLLSLVVLLWGLASRTHAQLDAETERARIVQERSAADQRLREQEKACEARFVVTSCLEAARQTHRDTVAPLRQQEFLLDDAQRQQRAAQRRAELQEKAARTNSDKPGAQPVVTDDAVSVPKQNQPSSRKAPTPKEQTQIDQQRAKKQAAGQAQADQRVKSQQKKLELAQQRKAEVEKRNAEKAASGKPPAAALKVPPAGHP